MADIFISYGREDQETARMLAQALAGQRWSVWWDQSIPPGKTWADVVGKQLTAARCVLALWSKTSVTKRWVLKEARFADKRGTLIPVLIEDVEPPFEFGDIQAANLKNWQGDVSHSGYTHLLESVSEVLSTPLPATTDEQNAIGTKHLAVEGPTVSHYHSPEPIDGEQRTLDEPGSARVQNELSKDKAQSIKGLRTWFATLVKPSNSPIIMFMLGIAFFTLDIGLMAWVLRGNEYRPNTVRLSINIFFTVVTVYAIYLIFYSLFSGIRKIWLARRRRNKGSVL